MKAAIRNKYGLPKSIEIQHIPTPKPKPNELLVKVKASTINRTDVAILTGQPFIMRFFTGLFAPKLKSTGTDFAGIVEEVGSNVSNFKVDERVFGFDDQGIGSHREFFTIDANKPISIIPSSYDFNKSAASLEGVHYAFNFLNKVQISAKSKVLLIGGTGAIGSAMIQMVNDIGADLTVVCGTDGIDLVKKLGIEKVIDYQKVDYISENIKDGIKYDFVFDSVGKSSFGKCKAIMTENGIYTSSELGDNSENIFYALFTPLLSLLKISTQKVIFPIPSNINRSMEFIIKMINQGKFTPLIDRTYPIDQISEAFEYVISGQKLGNVIITFE